MQFLRWILAIIWVAIISIFGSLLGLLLFRNPRVVQWCGVSLGWGIRKVFGFQIAIENREYLNVTSPTVFIANHQSALDIASFGQIIPPKTVAVGKKELWYIPLFGFLFFIAGNLLINRKDRTQSIEVMKSLKNKIHRERINVIIFPEGTRNRNASAGFLPFKRGAFHLAIAANLPIVPIVCGPVNHVLKRPGAFLYMKVLPPIQLSEMTSEQMTEKIESIRNEMYNEFKVLSKKTESVEFCS
jgi:1-acyl-sn-glycerol-3-phosphate acyltransferase